MAQEFLAIKPAIGLGLLGDLLRIEPLVGRLADLPDQIPLHQPIAKLVPEAVVLELLDQLHCVAHLVVVTSEPVALLDGVVLHQFAAAELLRECEDFLLQHAQWRGLLRLFGAVGVQHPVGDLEDREQGSVVAPAELELHLSLPLPRAWRKQPRTSARC